MTKEFKKSFVSDDDVIYLEDETGRVLLDLSQIKPIENNDYILGLKPVGSKFTILDFVTGQVVALIGTFNGKKIIAEELIFPGLKCASNPVIYK